MFYNIFQKAALLGASTVASVAATGAMMANPVQAATMSYTSQFSVTSNSLETKLGNGEVLTGDFSFTKTELASGKFSYKLTDFNASSGASLSMLDINESLNLSDVKANPNPFLEVNQAFVPEKYQAILPSVLADENSNYVGDGDFPPADFTRAFSGAEFSEMADEYNLSSLISTFLPSEYAQQAEFLLGAAFGKGGEVSLMTTSTSQSSFTQASVPEPTTIFGLGVIGIGLVATRRKRTIRKIKQKIAA